MHEVLETGDGQGDEVNDDEVVGDGEDTKKRNEDKMRWRVGVRDDEGGDVVRVDVGKKLMGMISRRMVRRWWMGMKSKRMR